MPEGKVLLDETALQRALTRLSFEIVEKTKELDKLVLVGIKTRGTPMANLLAERIRQHGGPDVPVCQLDITFYRDDLTKKYDMPLARAPQFDLDITGREIVLVDDVIFTGRTIRAAIEALFSVGRPAKIALAVMVDRGHRELPIKPDYVGKNIPTSLSEFVRVNMKETDGCMSVELCKKE